MMNKYVLLWLALLITVEAAALYALQRYAKDKSQRRWYILSALIYGLGVTYILIKTLKYKDIGMVNFLWNIGSTLSGFLIGIYLFGEKVKNVQLMGVGVSLLGLAMILLSDRKEVDRKER